jgi:hypothetical protein
MAWHACRLWVKARKGRLGSGLLTAIDKSSYLKFSKRQLTNHLPEVPFYRRGIVVHSIWGEFHGKGITASSGLGHLVPAQLHDHAYRL